MKILGRISERKKYNSPYCGPNSHFVIHVVSIELRISIISEGVRQGDTILVLISVVKSR